MGGLALAGPSPCDTESAYYCISVVADRDDTDGRTLILDRLTHAYVDLADPTVVRFGYVQRFADAAGPYLDALDRPIDVLHLGGGGFTFPRYLEATRPGARQVVLELDPRVLQVAREQLGFTPSDDARRSGSATPAARSRRCRPTPSTSSSATRSAGSPSRGTSRRPSSSARSSASCGPAGCT